MKNYKFWRVTIAMIVLSAITLIWMQGIDKFEPLFEIPLFKFLFGLLNMFLIGHNMNLAEKEIRKLKSHVWKTLVILTLVYVVIYGFKAASSTYMLIYGYGALFLLLLIHRPLLESERKKRKRRKEEEEREDKLKADNALRKKAEKVKTELAGPFNFILKYSLNEGKWMVDSYLNNEELLDFFVREVETFSCGEKQISIYNDYRVTHLYRDLFTNIDFVESFFFNNKEVSKIKHPDPHAVRRFSEISAKVGELESKLTKQMQEIKDDLKQKINTQKTEALEVLKSASDSKLITDAIDTISAAEIALDDDTISARAKQLFNESNPTFEAELEAAKAELEEILKKAEEWTMRFNLNKPIPNAEAFENWKKDVEYED